MPPGFTSDAVPRYTQRPLPPYRYLPFRNDPRRPHPRNDPAGHSYSQEEDYLPHFASDDWATCEPYLFGIDLFNHGYWWEAHDALETVWLAAGQKSTVCGLFIQGLIQLAGAQLKRFMDEPRGASSLTGSGSVKLALVEGIYLGIVTEQLIADAQRCLRENRGEYPRIILHFS
jgi:hypothetical protein